MCQVSIYRSKPTALKISCSQEKFQDEISFNLYLGNIISERLWESQNYVQLVENYFCYYHRLRYITHCEAGMLHFIFGKELYLWELKISLLLSKHSNILISTDDYHYDSQNCARDFVNDFAFCRLYKMGYRVYTQPCNKKVLNTLDILLTNEHCERSSILQKKKNL